MPATTTSRESEKAPVEQTSNRVLVCDDERNMRRLLNDLLEDDGWDVAAVSSAEEAETELAKGEFTAVVLDLALPGMNGLELLQRMRARNDDTAVVVITAFATIDVAVRAMKGGAVDFLVKPFDNARLKTSLRKIRESRDLLDRASMSLPTIEASVPGTGNVTYDIIGTDKKMTDVFSIVRKVASTRACVLISGESGTGKELVAQAIHFNGDRRDQRFVTVNCASLPETILESELFGLERGAFSGAYAVQRGRVEVAEGGTLFLDDVGDMPASLQVKLLRLLQSGKFTHTGGDQEVTADVRVIAATNHDLAESVRSKEFREDLFYQLDVISIHLPPLRERREDIGHLVTAFVDRFSRRHRQPPLKVPSETLAALMKYHWPGNIRELQNCVEKAVVLQDLGALIPEPEISPSIAFHKSAAVPAEDEAIVDLGEGGRIRPLHEVAADAQRAAVIRAIRLCDNNKAEAAKRLDVSYKTLFNKIHELGIQFQTTVE